MRPSSSPSGLLTRLLTRLLSGLLGRAPLAGLGLSGLGRLLLRGRLAPLAGLLLRCAVGRVGLLLRLLLVGIRLAPLLLRGSAPRGPGLSPAPAPDDARPD